MILNTTEDNQNSKLMFVHQKAVIQTFHTSFLTTQNLCEITCTITQIQTLILYSVLKTSSIQKKIRLRFGMTNSI